MTIDWLPVSPDGCRYGHDFVRDKWVIDCVDCPHVFDLDAHVALSLHDHVVRARREVSPS